MGLLALAMAAPAVMAAETDDDYKAEAAIRVCASVVRSQGYPWFRADYDRGRKSVQTNIQSGDQEGAISPFENCWMSQGGLYPITTMIIYGRSATLAGGAGEVSPSPSIVSGFCRRCRTPQ
jgi:hypothetical protein